MNDDRVNDDRVNDDRVNDVLSWPWPPLSALPFVRALRFASLEDIAEAEADEAWNVLQRTKPFVLVLDRAPRRHCPRMKRWLGSLNRSLNPITFSILLACSGEETPTSEVTPETTLAPAPTQSPEPGPSAIAPAPTPAPTPSATPSPIPTPTPSGTTEPVPSSTTPDTPSDEDGGAGGSSPEGMGGQSAGGAAGTEGSAGAGEGGAPNGDTGVGEPGNYPKGNPPVPSAACGTPTTLTTGERRINSTNQDRVYYLDIPADYDPNHPYRLFYISHWIGSRYQDMVGNNFYNLKTRAQAAGEPAIFIAPSSDGATWQQKDHALFDDLLAFAKENLCFDTSRVFATGFSFGGMITYSLSTNHQKDIRAAVGIGPANYNIWLPQKTREPIAWMQTTGMGDTTTPWVQGNSSTNGAKFLAIEKAEDNNCTPAEIPTWQNGPHVCYDYQGCDENFPVKVCTFNGGHQAESSDPGSNENWIPRVSWEFFTQF